MSFPRKIRHKRQEAVIYGKTAGYPFYRVSAKVAGKRVLKTFAAFAEAEACAQKLVRDLDQGKQSAALSDNEATDALAIRATLDDFRRNTGKTISALEAVKAYVSATKLLGDRDLLAAVRGYLNTVVTIKCKDVAEAVREFLAAREPKTIAKPGERPQLNPIYHTTVTRYLTEFAETVPGHTVSDLTREHLNVYLAAHAKLAPKSRNDRRACLTMFFRWCVKRDYLSAAHRLREADGLEREDAAPEVIESYTAAELRQMLEAASGEMRVVIALQSLAGLRLQEVVRLDWREVFRIPGHVEITAGKSKTRQRRLVEICPSLAAWLEPFRAMSGPVWTTTTTMQGCITAMARFRESLKIPSRRNGLRHGFVSAHFALHGNENLTAKEAGNSPTVLHRDYKGLLTKADAQAWFAVAPAEAAANIVPISAAVA